MIGRQHTTTTPHRLADGSRVTGAGLADQSYIGLLCLSMDVRGIMLHGNVRRQGNNARNSRQVPKMDEAPRFPRGPRWMVGATGIEPVTPTMST